MKKINCFLLYFVFLALFSATAFAQKDKEQNKYKQRTLAELGMFNREYTAENRRKSKMEEKFDFISADPFYSKTRLQFTGSWRPISQDSKDLMRMWGKLLNVDKKFVSLYETELLFKEGDEEFWIPTQKKVSEKIFAEVKTNDMITLYVINIGGRKAAMAKEYSWLYVSTAFEK